MRSVFLVCVTLGFAGAVSAQQTQQDRTVSMQCRDLSSTTGNFVGPDEVLVNGMACKPIKQSATPKMAAAVQPVAQSAQMNSTTPGGPAPTATAAPQPSVVSDTKVDDQPAVGYDHVPAGARIVIAPMGGFETYFAAAVRNKKVPVTLTLEKEHAQFFVVSTETEWHGFVYGSGGSASWSQNGGSAAHGSAASSTRGLEASIMLIDAKTKDVVWAYEVHKNSHGALLFGTHATRGQQSLAEACAKHLREFIEKGK